MKCRLYFIVLLMAFSVGLKASERSNHPLSSLCSVDFLKNHLVQPEAFTPVPAYGDSFWQDSVPAEMRASYIQEGEKYLSATWKSIDISLFSEYRKEGDRTSSLYLW